MWKKLIIIAGVVGVAALVAKKVKAMNEERALWHEATTSAEDVNLPHRERHAKLHKPRRPGPRRPEAALPVPRGRSSIGRALPLQGRG